MVRGAAGTGASQRTACDNHPFLAAEFRVAIGGESIVCLMTLCKECREFADQHANGPIYANPL